jgi:hypothetical protein
MTDPKQIKEGYQPKPNRVTDGYQPTPNGSKPPSTPPPGFGTSIQAPTKASPVPKK